MDFLLNCDFGILINSIIFLKDILNFIYDSYNMLLIVLI